jgi:transmembrane sensor
MSEQHSFGEATSDELWEAVARVAAGEATPREQLALRAHLEAHPERAALLDALDGAVNRYAAVRPAVDVEAALVRVMARRDRRPAAQPAWVRPLMRIAAVLVVALGVSLLWRTIRSSEPPLVYVTAAGQSRTVMVADGSVIRLGPGSRLAVSGDYGRPSRQVELQGEAFFEVRHDAEHPFVVRTATAEIQDLGTAFMVRTGPDRVTRVAVTEGVVGLSRPEAAPDSILRAGDRGQVDAGGRVSVLRRADLGAELAWRQGRLVVQELALAELAPEFARWYGVTLVVRDAGLARRRITATFPAGAPDDALRILGAALGAEVRRTGDTAVVLRRQAP